MPTPANASAAVTVQAVHLAVPQPHLTLIGPTWVALAAAVVVAGQVSACPRLAELVGLDRKTEQVAALLGL
jgi:hypothetical protein